jgi:predicted membrane protein DUF2207
MDDVPLNALLPPLILAAYYLVVWTMVGRDPKPDTVVPRYAPPEGISPAAARYVVYGGTDGKSIAAILAHLASQKFISITPIPEGYRVAGLPQPEARRKELPLEEQRFLSLYFAFGDPNVIRPTDYPRQGGLISGVQGALDEQYRGRFVTGNYLYLALGVAATLVWALATAAGFHANSADGAVFLTLWFLFFSLILGSILLIRVFPAMADAVRGRMGTKNVLQTFVPFPILLALPGFVAYRLGQMTSAGFAWTLVTLVAITLIFGPLLKRPTAKGRAVCDELAGYRHFLESVEKDPLNRNNDPHRSPQMLTESLPYAIALEVKEAWGDHLSDAFFGATVSKG